MKYVVTYADREISVEVDPRDDGMWDVTSDGRSIVADLRGAGGQSLFSLLLGQSAYEVSVVRSDDQYRVGLRGHDITLTVESEQQKNARLVDAASGDTGPQTVKSVMPGRVVKILVREGEQVTAGTPLLILEAMKMENEIRSPSEGTVTGLLVAEGATVGNGAPLVTVE